VKAQSDEIRSAALKARSIEQYQVRRAVTAGARVGRRRSFNAGIEREGERAVYA
jgi:hypothetical protein